MKVLVIDTALGACTVGVFDGDRALAVRSELMSKGHAERIGGLVRDVVAEAVAAEDGLIGGFDALERVGVTVGPGSFTGLRVGLAFAQGLGGALNIPVVGISTLAALARSVGPDTPGGAGTVAAIDARRGQVYLQTYRHGVVEGVPEALAVEAAIDRLGRSGGGQRWSFVGSGASLLDEAASDPLLNPTAVALANLTVAADPAEAPPNPLYLRAPDATPPTRLPGQPRAAVARP
jgi:tRNA threonylcarbamoyladenosine biosynthesis protein TsaB